MSLVYQFFWNTVYTFHHGLVYCGRLYHCRHCGERWEGKVRREIKRDFAVFKILTFFYAWRSLFCHFCTYIRIFIDFSPFSPGNCTFAHVRGHPCRHRKQKICELRKPVYIFFLHLSLYFAYWLTRFIFSGKFLVSTTSSELADITLNASAAACWSSKHFVISLSWSKHTCS